MQRPLILRLTDASRAGGWTPFLIAGVGAVLFEDEGWRIGWEYYFDGLLFFTALTALAGLHTIATSRSWLSVIAVPVVFLFCQKWLVAFLLMAWTRHAR